MSEVKVNKLNTRTNTALTIQQNSTTAMTIDTSQNVLVGKSAIALATVGGELRADGQITGTRSGNPCLVLNRTTSDGEIAQFYKDASKVGSIYNGGGNLGIDSNGGLLLVDDIITPTSGADNTKDIGRSSARWKDLYLGGKIYIGGTGSANALDDYEEGTFSPTVEGHTTAGSVTYTTREGFYTKVGNCVIFNIFVRWQSGTGAGNLKITGLPFTSYATTLHHAVTIGWMNDYNYTNGKIPRAYINNNATRINFEESTDSGTSTNLAYDSQAGLILSGSYQTN